MLVEVRKGSLGFEKVVVLGKNWKTDIVSVCAKLKNSNLGVLASENALLEALERGYARYNQSIAVWQDDTMY